MDYIPSPIENILLKFQDQFSAPSFQNFKLLMIGWMLCVNRHSISRVIQYGVGKEGYQKNHAAYYRFFSRAEWNNDHLGKVLFEIYAEQMNKEKITLIIDDTLHHRSGPHLWGGMHVDLAGSTYGKRTASSPQKKKAFGHNLVTLSLWVQKPWSDKGRGWPFPS